MNNKPYNIEMAGYKRGKITVTGFAFTRNKNKYWNCVCECGRKTIMSYPLLVNPKTKSCGKCSTNTFIEHDNYYSGFTKGGYEYFFDKDDFERISEYSWCESAKYLITKIDGKIISMHRFIMGKIPSGLESDHINRKQYDNRKTNLRPVTRTENNRNRSCCKSIRENLNINGQVSM